MDGTGKCKLPSTPQAPALAEFNNQQEKGNLHLTYIYFEEF
jgi:hypothetical protein